MQGNRAPVSRTNVENASASGIMTRESQPVLLRLNSLIMILESNMGELPYRICTQCIMDTTDPDISFDGVGVCNHCRSYEAIVDSEPPLAERERQLDSLVAKISQAGKRQDYDCIVGMSGGVDSSYLAYLAKSRGLRPLAVHVDAG